MISMPCSSSKCWRTAASSTPVGDAHQGDHRHAMRSASPKSSSPSASSPRRSAALAWACRCQRASRPLVDHAQAPRAAAKSIGVDNSPARVLQCAQVEIGAVGRCRRRGWLERVCSRPRRVRQRRQPGRPAQTLLHAADRPRRCDQSSKLTSQPPRLSTASTTNRLPASRQARPISSSGCRMPVDVSACTIATSFGLAPACDGVNHRARLDAAGPIRHRRARRARRGESRACTAVRRSGRRPQPARRSPGSIRLARTASMPAREAPGTASVGRFAAIGRCAAVRLATSSSKALGHGSSAASGGAAIARSTRGSGLLGPEPISRRRGGSSGFAGDGVHCR